MAVIPEYSFVIPILNERDTLPELQRRLDAVMNQLDGPAEIVLVDDGSTDGSFDVIKELNARDPRVKALRLSRNFGHQIALTAGIDHALGNAVIIMDGDLQDPPEVALELARRWREGFDVVYAIRDERDGESPLKLATAKWFYRIMGRMSEVPIPVDAGDFRLVDRRAVDAVTSMREHSRYLRGMFAWVGYDQTGVRYTRSARHAGRTKFSLRKMLSFAVDGIVSFSAVPLRLALALGFAVSALSMLAGALAIIFRLTGVYLVSGWASIVVGVSFLGGIQLTVLGVMGSYIASIHEEVKGRPLYLVRDRVGGEGAARANRSPGASATDAGEVVDR
jgi:glycosyltransferase involved in cell wall biosynthesis